LRYTFELDELRHELEAQLPSSSRRYCVICGKMVR
jgi:hypothetical protein